jgi:Endonuclease-reverse transcriptase
MSESTTTNKTLRIKQQNCKHSKDITLTLMNMTDPLEWDLLLLQEPYIYPRTRLSPATANWYIMYPIQDNNDISPPRSIILISTQLTSDSFRQIQIKSHTISAITFTYNNDSNIDIYNIYNPPDSNTAFTHLQQWLVVNPTHAESSVIWAGDFNKHNPIWSGPNQMRRSRLSNTELLTQLLAEQHMELQLTPGTHTYQSDSHRTWTTIDLLFCDTDLTPKILTCQAAPNDRIPTADHLPIHTTLDLEVDRRRTIPGRNFHNVDWKSFRKKLNEDINQHGPYANTSPTTEDQLDDYIYRLTNAIQACIDAQIPRLRISPFSKRWWNRNLTSLRHEYAIKGREEYRSRFTANWEYAKHASNVARNTYISALRKAKADHWKGWIEEANEKDVWTAGKYAKNPLSDGAKPRIPTLTRKDADGQATSEAYSNADKASTFTELFFPPRPHNLPNLPEDTTPHPSPLKFTTPAPHQIQRRIRTSKPFKAPGIDGIPNIVLKECEDTLTPLLHTCLLAILKLKYFPKTWRTWKTIVLRKPGRPDYTIAKAYRPIALYNTMGKIISGVMTDITVYLTIRHNLLPPRHFGGLPGKTTIDSLLHLTHRIKTAWRNRKVVMVIFLDIANAFPNAVTNRLLKNMSILSTQLRS